MFGKFGDQAIEFSNAPRAGSAALRHVLENEYVWRVECEATSNNGGGIEVYYVLTRDSTALPDIREAAGGDRHVYHIRDIRPVDNAAGPGTQRLGLR